MNSGFPSMTALLGLLAVAGYQNRDKIAEWVGSGAQSPVPGGAPAGQAPQPRAQGGGLAGILEGLGNNLRGATPGGILSGGLGELIDRFKQNGHAETADSWVGHGANKPIAPPELERAIGSRRAGHPIHADRAVAARAARPLVARASRRGGQVHARRPIAASGLSARLRTGGLPGIGLEDAPGGQIGEGAARDERLSVGAPSGIGRQAAGTGRN